MVDLPGHGDSAPLAGPLTLDRLTDVLQQWLASHDLGGAVALTDLRSIADTAALGETLKALVDSGPQLGGPTPGRVLLGWGRRDRVTLPRQAARAQRAFPQATLH